jgi:hypothetical protein
MGHGETSVVSALGPILCRRRLQLHGARGRTVAVVSLGIPKRRSPHWVCGFHISGIGMDEPDLVPGEDAFQALIMALVGIRWTIDGSRFGFSWLTRERGDHGFHRFINDEWGVELRSKLERMVDREVDRFVRATTPRHILRATAKAITAPDACEPPPAERRRVGGRVDVLSMNALGQVICRRRLRLYGGRGRKFALVRLGMPRRHGRAWVCNIHISGVGMDEPWIASGADAFQALIVAIATIRGRIDKSGFGFSWLAPERGAHGFPRFIHERWGGIRFRSKLERMVDREVDRFVRAMTRRQVLSGLRPKRLPPSGR